MTEGPLHEGGDGHTTTGPKPSIAEVAAWLRRAAEQRDGGDDLGPGHRPSDPAETPAPEGDLEGAAAAIGTLTPEPGTPEVAAEGDPSEHCGEAQDGLAARDEAVHPLDPLGSALELGTAGDPVEEAHPSEEQAGEAGAGPGGATIDLRADLPTDQVPVVGSSPVDAPKAGVAGPAEAPSDEVIAGEVRPEDAVGSPVSEDEEPAERDEPADHVDPSDDVAVDETSIAVAAPEEVEPDEPASDGGPGDVVGPQAGEAFGRHEPASEMPHVEARLVEPAEVELDPEGSVDAADDNVPAASMTAATLERDDTDAFGVTGEQAPAGHTIRPFGLRRSFESQPAESDLDDPASPQPAVAAIAAELDDGREVPDGETGEPPPGGEDEDEPPRAEAQGKGDPESGSEPGATDEPDGLDAGAFVHGEPAPAPKDGRSLASLFDLDLAELAARARRAGERESRSAQSPFDAGAGAEDDDPESNEPGALRVEAPGTSPQDDDLERAETVRHPVAAQPRSGALVWDEDELEIRDDQQPAEATAPVETVKPVPRAAPAMAAVAAAMRRRHVKRKRYPRGQLKERIGILRRIRAMLGVVVLTVILGVAAGAAIGAFLVFLAFAVRGAITSG